VFGHGTREWPPPLERSTGKNAGVERRGQARTTLFTWRAVHRTPSASNASIHKSA
jgi:hypothetical protein